MIPSLSSSASVSAYAAASANASAGQRPPVAPSTEVAESGRSDAGSTTSPSSSTAGQLTAEQRQQIQQLVAIDRKVRDHEQAHLAAAADLARSGASFGYATGPDNRQYAVSGEVSIDVSPARTPQETIAKAQRIRAAALAPADPSSQDGRVAALAGRMESEARIELARLAQEESATAGSRQGDAATQAYRAIAGAETIPLAPGSGLNLFA